MPITFTYLNHRGARSVRTVDFESLDFIREPGFGYQSGWFISGYDHERTARRSFALTHILFEPAVPLKHFFKVRPDAQAE